MCQLCSEVQRQETGPALETFGVGGKADSVPWEQRTTQARLAGRLQKGVTLHPLGGGRPGKRLGEARKGETIGRRAERAWLELG